MRVLLLFFVAIAETSAAGRLTDEENRELQSTCGTTRDIHRKVNNGTVPKSFKESPTAVAVGVMNTTGEISGHCSGTLISPRHVLTAAHCVEAIHTTYVDCRQRRLWFDKKRFFVFTRSYCILGPSIITSERNCPKKSTDAKKHRVVAIRAQIEYFCGHMGRKGNGEFDIAILEIEPSIERSHNVAFACITDSIIRPMDEAIFFGYGEDHRPNISYPNGILKSFKADHVHCLNPLLDETTLICFRNYEWKWTCAGDSGGGFLFLDHNRRMSVVAVNVQGENCTSYTGGKDHLLESIAQEVSVHRQFFCDSVNICRSGFRPNYSSPNYYHDNRTK